MTSSQYRFLKWIFIIGLALIPLLGNSATQATFFDTLSEAYIAVTVFVAFTLTVFYGLEYIFQVDIGQLLHKYKQWHIPLSALMGALPGCGGAIIVMTQYSIGRLGFGSVVAVLTSTMGDAAFLLLAKEPRTGFLIMGISIIVGIVFGYIVERIHGVDFLKVQKPAVSDDTKKDVFSFGYTNCLWLFLLIPGICLGFLSAFQVDIDAFVSIDGFERWFGVVGLGITLLMWLFNPQSGPSINLTCQKKTWSSVGDRITMDTAFVTVWVVLAFLSFELPLLWTGYDLKEAFTTMKPLMPLVGVLIGFLPGCGPQILTTMLYLQGVIPLSAQLGNAISNDGDALFPALAVAPRASIVATLYTAIPALIVSYGYFFLFEL